MKIYTGAAGAVTVDFTLFRQFVCLHLFPRAEFRLWGYVEDWYDGPLPEFGLGRLALICWVPKEDPRL